MLTQEQKSEYQKKYQKAYRQERKSAMEASMNGYLVQPVIRNKLRSKNKNIIQYKGMGEVKCVEFGCGRELSIREQLFGNKCINHSIK